MEHKYDDCTGTLIIRMPREVDHHSAEFLRQETDYIMFSHSVREIIFDFQDTIFMDSSGIGVVLGRCRNLKFSGGKTWAIHLQPRIERIFQMCGLHKVITII